MPGTTPPTSQLDWLISRTAMIVLFWSRAMRDLLKSFGWGIAALHQLNAATKLPPPRPRPIESSGSARCKRDSRDIRRGERPNGRDVPKAERIDKAIDKLIEASPV